MTWALFDLDDTVLDHDSFERFTIHLLRRNPVRMAGAVVLLPVIGVLLVRRTWRIHAGSLLLWLGTVGIGDVALAEFVQRYLDGLGIAGRIRPGAADALEKHFLAGDHVAVVTACAEHLAGPLCHAIDPRILVVGSTLKRRAGGLVADRHCHGARKVDMLVESGVDGEIVACYGDSSSDAPMLDLAQTAVLVNLSEKDARQIREHLTRPDRVMLVDWPPPRESVPAKSRGKD